MECLVSARLPVIPAKACIQGQSHSRSVYNAFIFRSGWVFFSTNLEDKVFLSQKKHQLSFFFPEEIENSMFEPAWLQTGPKGSSWEFSRSFCILFHPIKKNVPVRLKSKLRKLENSIRHLQSEVIS
jgi:hypothetical protein